MAPEPESVSDAPAVAVEGLGKRFDPAPGWLRLFLRSPVRHPVQALDDVSFAVGRGEVCAIAGANGAGKSTLFRVLIGLVLPTTGSARVLGISGAERSLDVRRAIGFVPADDRSLWLNLNCVANLRFRGRVAGLSGATLDRRVAQVLDQVELVDAADRIGHALSAGMRARLQLACALLHDPPVLILDEPTASVDPVGAHRLLGLLQERAATRGTCILYSTHRVEELEALAASVLLLDRGRVLHRGSLDELRRRHERPRWELTFRDHTSAEAAAAVLRQRDRMATLAGTVVTLETEEPLGELLAVLGEHVSRIADARHERQPLRDLLAVVLGDQP